MAALGGHRRRARLCGVANGVLITRLRVVPFIVTLGMMILRARRGEGPRRRAPDRSAADVAERPAAHARARTARFLVPAGIWLVIVLALVVGGHARVTRASAGISSRSARTNGRRASAASPVERTKIAVYTIAAALAGVAGVLQFSRLSVGDPTVADGLSSTSSPPSSSAAAASPAGAARSRERSSARRRWP